MILLIFLEGVVLVSGEVAWIDCVVRY
jgi:hypothetical protein